ncbi:MAG: efflux RND transporter periplasmic adaptor subunit [Dysgonamonadaceae bacterium]|nr:efflux RND transporter periplasmic adaptor subunit [Dysgonamonadaceae bacterium]MDD4728106.1 efflux RND transporter periplasmic adaptor subunit [Dysgonamonadaceae bacterium]
MKKILKIAGLLLLGLLVIWTFVFLWKKSRPQIKNYQIEQAQNATIEKKTVATGKVQPRNEILIKPQMSGIIAELYKEAGDKVNAGDIIAKIKVIPDMVTLSSAETRLTRSKLIFDQSETNFKRDSILFNEDVISKEEYEKVRLQYRNDREELKSAEDNLSLVRDGLTTRTASSSNTLIRSTVSGTILDVPIKVGNSVIQSNNFNDGTTIASVADMNDMLFVGNIDETEVGKISVGMPMKITIGAMQDETLTAELEYVSPKGTEAGGAILFEMKAAMNIPSNIFVRAGYSANAEIILEKRENVLTIPESSVEFNVDSAFVYLVTKQKPQEFERKLVKIGLSDGIKIEVTEGLKENDKIRGNEIVETK